MGNLDLDFAALLVALTAFTGFVWAIDHWLFRPRRLRTHGDQAKEPVLVEYCRSFFPVIFLVLMVRSFLAEPFRIPSDSMMPTLFDGDFILVNKYAYGLRVPVTNAKVIPVGQPARGDVVVFRYPGMGPNDPTKGSDYIKRVIGLPGDEVTYRGRTLYVNGVQVATLPDGSYSGTTRSKDYVNYTRVTEKLPELDHEILLGPPPGFAGGPEGSWRVSEGHFLVMGDNRSNSLDGRVWGLVPEANLVGKAFVIWMNWDFKDGGVDFGRLGTVIK